MDRNPNFIPPEVLVDGERISLPEVRRLSTTEMTKVRDEITNSLMAIRRCTGWRCVSSTS